MYREICKLLKRDKNVARKRFPSILHLTFSGAGGSINGKEITVYERLVIFPKIQTMESQLIDAIIESNIDVVRTLLEKGEHFGINSCKTLTYTA